ncbi:MAG TPA: O-acetyl-ADP-ribose deacetylase [Rhodanobacter sp.]|jgi:O-acetyl-ADP-ribose deacetylase (regulator of RNase III)|nr:O-acetyl-ADP-ribose deacetylase [Rhodanobacter sp.]
MPITLIQADITTLAVDAIVNAANPSLLGGGGVDGAIHRAAGARLLQACRALPEIAPGVRCASGDARLTPGFDLPARHVIHAVGPIWHGGTRDEARVLANCYTRAMQLLEEQQLRSIAFPAISCGVYGYPAQLAAKVAVAALRKALADRPAEVVLCSFNATIRQAFQAALDAASTHPR